MAGERSTPGARTRRRSWWRRLPIRVRLIAGFAIAMLIVLAAAGAFVYLRVQYALDRRLDADLGAESQAVTAALHDGTLNPRNPAVVSGGLYQILDAHGTVLNASPGLTGQPLLDPAQTTTALHDDVHVDHGTLLPISAQPLRVLATPLTPGTVPATGQPAIVVSAVRRDQRDEALRELIAQLTLANLAALAIASVVGYRLARAALDPVEKYRSQAAHIAAGATHIRLDTPDTDDEIARLGATLNDMLTALDQALQRERRFVADASHELRTPLTLLAAELELALRRPRPAAELEQALRAAADDTDALIRLADALLAVGTQAGPGNATPFIDIAAQVAPTVDRYRLAHDLDPTALTADLAPTPALRMEPALLERILTNLLDNAVRHGRPPVTVTTDTVEDYARLGVHDDGQIPPEFLPHAAERFTRADPARTSPGAGLGLSLVDAIIVAHNGQLWLCSGPVHHHTGSTFPACLHPGAGTTATILLPASETSSEPLAKAS